jgi:nucleotide-binding universal stress UspA family protein
MSAHQVRPVVAGTDGSVQAGAAVDLAAWEAARRGSPLRIVHGYQVPVPYTTMGFAPVQLEYPMPATRTMLTETVARVRRDYPTLLVEPALIAGSPAGTLVEESREASLVVVGSRGLGGFAGLLAGSVSTQLAAHAQAPLIVVRGDARRDRPVVVGVDGTPGGDAAVAFAFDEAAARGVLLIALYAWWTLPWSNLGPIDLRHYELDEAREEARRMLAEAVAGWVEKYPDVIVEQRAAHDLNPALALEDAADAAGLLVVSRHGGNALTRLLLGSIGDALVRHAPCPVALIPEPLG